MHQHHGFAFAHLVIARANTIYIYKLRSQPRDFAIRRQFRARLAGTEEQKQQGQCNPGE
jgi:hypothetical protein